jgi:two-component system cell cycle sensor histidine kinase/response regulator CckA
MPRVLIVDDEESIRFSYKKFLTDSGYDVAVASHLLEAKALLPANEFAVAIVDRILGDDNGMDLVKHIRKTQPFCEPILISAYPSFESASETLQYDVSAYLTKPIVKKKLCQAVDDAVRKNRIKKESQHNEIILQSLFDSSPDAIVISDLSHKTSFVNPAFTRIFGYAKEEVMGKCIPYVPDWDMKQTESERNDLVMGKAVRERESKRLTKNGRSVDISMTQFLCRDGNGEPIDILTIIRDITDKRKIEKQLIQAQKMEAIGTLAGGIAHDFNNLLFIISGYTEMSMGDLPEGNRIVENMAQVRKALNRAKELVKQIFTFSRMEEQKKKPMLIQPIIKEALAMLRATLPSTIEIRKEIHDDCKCVSADPTRIHQVIMNLCTNAYHAMREKGGVLEVVLRGVTLDIDDTADYLSLSPGQYVMLKVSDTGKGIEESVIERIFEPYFTTKAKGEGTGMGLAMVHGIVKSLGGDIEVSSKPGKGATFYIYLPEVTADSMDAEKMFLDFPVRGNERILLVDDEEQIVEMLQEMLEHLGYRLTVTTSSEEALKLFHFDPDAFDLVITDQTMPKITGVELSKRLRDIRFDIPVVLCTGYNEMVAEGKLNASGINEYLIKPVQWSEMAWTVRKLLNKKRLLSPLTVQQ